MADGPRLYRPRERELPAPDTAKLTASLNDDQARAATFGDGPLLVIAGAGTGKTRTLIYRVAHLIERGVAPERILLLTFTRRAARRDARRAPSGRSAPRARGCTAGRSTPSAIACCASSVPQPACQPTSPSWTRATPRT